MCNDMSQLGKIMPNRHDEDYDFFARAYCDNHTFTFPVFYRQSSVKDIEKVNPIKQVEVSRIYEVIKDCEFIKHAWIIGSACNPMCTDESDTDMIIETTIPANEEPEYYLDVIKQLYRIAKNGLDLLRLEELSPAEPISYEIYWRLQLK